MLKIGSRILVHAYKHNAQLYKSWEYPKVLYSDDKMIGLLNQNSSIFQNDKKPRTIKEAAIWFFLKDEWYNFIVILKSNKLQYYINIASPFIIEDNAIKYIDYDLDYRVLINKNFKRLDENEFLENSSNFSYPNKLINKIREVDEWLNKKLYKREDLIDKNFVFDLYNKNVKDYHE